LCSPTTHEGSFRCRLHRLNPNAVHNLKKSSSSPSQWPTKEASKIASRFHTPPAAAAATSIKAQ
jgi:hypothetical protein